MALSLSARPQNLNIGQRLASHNHNLALTRRQNNINQYNQNPKICTECGNVIPYNKRKNMYCSASCGAKHSNKNRTQSVYDKQKATLLATLTAQGKIHSTSPVPIRAPKPIKFSKIGGPYTKVKPCAKCGILHPKLRQKYCDKCNTNSNIRHYRSLASFNFNIYDYPDEFDLNLVNQLGWFSPNGYKRRNKTPNLGGVSRDHLYNIVEGFKNGKDPNILAHPANCRLMIHNGPNGNNSKKQSSITWDELLLRIEDWNKNIHNLVGSRRFELHGDQPHLYTAGFTDRCRERNPFLNNHAGRNFRICSSFYGLLYHC